MSEPIPFTQFLMPDGHRRMTSIVRPVEIERMAAQLIGLGYQFEIEMLQTGLISMEVVKASNREKVLAHELCPNGPPVLLAVDKLVLGAMDALPAKQKRIAQNK